MITFLPDKAADIWTQKITLTVLFYVSVLSVYLLVLVTRADTFHGSNNFEKVSNYNSFHVTMLVFVYTGLHQFILVLESAEEPFICGNPCAVQCYLFDHLHICFL